MKNTTYVPGVCNIGLAEINQRKRIGWIGLVVTIAVWVLFRYFQLNAAWYLVLFFPAALSAAGLIQGFSHFCAAFGMKGMFNVSEELRKMESVEQAQFRAQDKKKAIQIFVASLAIGVIVALAGYIVH